MSRPIRRQRVRRRALRHHAVLAAVSAFLLLAVYFTVQDDDVRFRWSMATAYSGLALLGTTLLIGPLNVLRGRPNPVSSDLRRDIGIWGALISLAHVIIGLQVHMGNMWLYFFREAGAAKPRSDLFGFANYTGLVAILIAALLLALSNDFSLRALGTKRWKALQRCNYALFALVVVHGVAYQAVENRQPPYIVLFGAMVVAVVVVQAAGFRHRRLHESSRSDPTRSPAGTGTNTWLWAKRVIGGLVLLVLVLALAGVAYQTIATANDARNYPPPGRMVDVDGHQMHINCTGRGSPTVILESGSPRTSLDWALVQPKLSKQTRVCSYDRAGYAWSEPSAEPCTAEHLAAELHTLTTNAKIGGPYVLVGHSWGGLIVRVYADRYPDEVAGVVLVDSTHPDTFRDTSAAEREKLERGIRGDWRRGMVATFGVTRLEESTLSEGSGNATRLPLLPPDARSALRAAVFRTSFFRTAYAEMAVWEQSMAQARAAAPLGDKPLVVVTRGLGLDARTRAEQTDLARLSSNSRQVIAERSDHYIMYRQPGLVTKAIGSVVDQARQEAPT